ncbi:hypothetical protein HPP92_017604 [Vanilla planifolia]|uniref:RRM domain-containing protein n=1 Tax=Vanilla planifolia TaxID=51239 RepID=A0A835UPJ6_VANPL|nr:hypothetical protein HPP92_017604 [Vanilla planifolia]
MGDDNKEVASLGAAAEFKFNVHAVEFVPRSVAQMPIPGYYYPYIHLLGGSNDVASDWLYFADQEQVHFVPDSLSQAPGHSKSANVVTQKIVKQVVSEDGKKVRRKKLFTERDKEELMLHAFVEFETSDQADKAVEKLNDERNWRKGLRVRLMLRRSPRSVIRGKRSDYDHFDMQSEDEQSPRNLVSSPKIDLVIEHKIDDSLSGAKKAWGRGRAKPHGHLQNYNGRGVLSQVPQLGQTLRLGSTENYSKPSSPGPRMPDGTRGFAIGRGKPLISAMDLAPIKL